MEDKEWFSKIEKALTPIDYTNYKILRFAQDRGMEALEWKLKNNMNIVKLVSKSYDITNKSLNNRVARIKKSVERVLK